MDGNKELFCEIRTYILEKNKSYPLEPKSQVLLCYNIQFLTNTYDVQEKGGL